MTISSGNARKVDEMSADRWVEVRSLQSIANDLAPEVTFPAAFRGLISDLIREAPDSNEIFLEGLNLDPPPGASEILLHEAILRERVYVNLSKLKSLWIDAAVALAVALSTGGTPVAPLMAAVIAGLRRVQVLNEDEAEVVHVLLGYEDINAYETPVPLERIRQSYEDASVDIDALLQKLHKRDVLDISTLGIQLNM